MQFRHAFVLLATSFSRRPRRQKLNVVKDKNLFWCLIELRRGSIPVAGTEGSDESQRLFMEWVSESI